MNLFTCAVTVASVPAFLELIVGTSAAPESIYTNNRKMTKPNIGIFKILKSKQTNFIKFLPVSMNILVYLYTNYVKIYNSVFKADGNI